MDEKEKRRYLEEYDRAKKRGIPFFPDAVFKDMLVGVVVLAILVFLAAKYGAPLEARADPADENYVPRPEWYFLFIFQLLKYFPGNLEVVGVIIIPVVVFGLLTALPFLDRSNVRHFVGRPVVTVVTGLFLFGIVSLTVLALAQQSDVRADEVAGDPVAALYVASCSGCHGPTIAVPAGVDLHSVISSGGHEGMPAWGADLSADEIDALEGFILSPAGSTIFAQQCGACHEASQLAFTDPFELRSALSLGMEYPSHADQDIGDWSTLDANTLATLLNFLSAPDGERLWDVNCARCHGSSVAVTGGAEEVKEIIKKGGAHLDMPVWRDILPADQLNLVARYVTNPVGFPEGKALYEANCVRCHGSRLPQTSGDVASNLAAIESGAGHETMPLWGDVLTNEQLDALVDYVVLASTGQAPAVGQALFSQFCSSCHGQFGEGGPHPSRSSDIIPPISTTEYLAARDNWTLTAIINQGQPDIGMSPMGEAYGGPLSEDEVASIVVLLRSWEKNPPVVLPPDIAPPTTQGGASVSDPFTTFCAQCHGARGQGGVGPALNTAAFQQAYTDQAIFDAIQKGHSATAMIAWGEILNTSQINDLVRKIRELGGVTPTTSPATTAPGGAAVTFSADVLPLFKSKCASCHGALGGWDAATRDKAVNSGNNGPAVLPGDPDGSLLLKRLLGQGGLMPPSGSLSAAEIELVRSWIAAGAP